jgi:hypothetical protein
MEPDGDCGVRGKEEVRQERTRRWAAATPTPILVPVLSSSPALDVVFRRSDGSEHAPARMGRTGTVVVGGAWGERMEKVAVQRGSSGASAGEGRRQPAGLEISFSGADGKVGALPPPCAARRLLGTPACLRRRKQREPTTEEAM